MYHSKFWGQYDFFCLFLFQKKVIILFSKEGCITSSYSLDIYNVTKYFK